MKKLEYTKLSGLLGSASTICCEEAKAVLAEFVEELQDYCRREPDFAERSRTLNFARSDLRVQLEYCSGGAGEKCTYPIAA